MQFLSEEFQVKLCKEMKKDLVVETSSTKTYVVVVAIHKNSSLNTVNKICCKKGIPIGGYVYDNQYDCYYYECFDYLSLGFIPLSFVLKIKNICNWQTSFPMTDALIKKHLDKSQKKELNSFILRHGKEDFAIQYVQILSCS